MRQRYRQSGYDRLNHLNWFEVKAPRVDESLLNTLLCFTTTDSLTWQRTELHKELFNLRHTKCWNSPTKVINTKRVILRNWIEATLNSFKQEPASLSKQRKTKLKLPKTPLPICSLGNRTEATLSQTNYQRADSTPNGSNPRTLKRDYLWGIHELGQTILNCWDNSNELPKRPKK